ncbi:AfsR/SARP family transcriptional regulator [Streptomyces lancefieldiae]|uniref:AfsR/SARP family transcriptional regulator n=1 Tax=Streptomyces lancefieldiae TaxID=3075520 RepID=A0ABU3B0U4_9ACTN|nr:AfsR/SARP family transcriptional regulator [Streptomyces sp. DSM 40712]MDT0616059.1 AfsR/SARP family transcriptional regulator [Streptomyces sp. DSM 40712]
MRYEIMGPVRVIHEEDQVNINAQKVATLLAVLLVRSNQVVTVDQLITEIWGDEPPRRVTAALHVYVSQIRKFLKRSGREDGPVLTRPHGYMLCLGSDVLDLRIFDELVGEGREGFRSRNFEAATRSFEEALGLCRGPLLGGACRGPILYGYQTWFNEVRLECMEMLIDARLALGRHRELVSDLYRLGTEHPLRETFHRQLMLALHRSDRQADALQVYQRARRTLNDELGLEPGRALQEMQHAILTADHRLVLPDCAPQL